MIALEEVYRPMITPRRIANARKRQEMLHGHGPLRWVEQELLSAIRHRGWCDGPCRRAVVALIDVDKASRATIRKQLAKR